jgi:hypothetical protein
MIWRDVPPCEQEVGVSTLLEEDPDRVEEATMVLLRVHPRNQTDERTIE